MNSWGIFWDSYFRKGVFINGKIYDSFLYKLNGISIVKKKKTIMELFSSVQKVSFVQVYGFYLIHCSFTIGVIVMRCSICLIRWIYLYFHLIHWDLLWKSDGFTPEMGFCKDVQIHRWRVMKMKNFLLCDKRNMNKLRETKQANKSEPNQPRNILFNDPI